MTLECRIEVRKFVHFRKAKVRLDSWINNNNICATYFFALLFKFQFLTNLTTVAAATIIIIIIIVIMKHIGQCSLWSVASRANQLSAKIADRCNGSNAYFERRQQQLHRFIHAYCTWNRQPASQSVSQSVSWFAKPHNWEEKKFCKICASGSTPVWPMNWMNVEPVSNSIAVVVVVWIVAVGQLDSVVSLVVLYLCICLWCAK